MAETRDAVRPSPALETLQRHYADRWTAVREAKQAGLKVVGVIGDAPVELVLASGAFPVRIAAPPPGPTPDADIYMDDIVPQDTHAFFQAAHDGVYADLDLLVLSREHDKLYYYLKEVERIGRGAQFPAVHMYDLMHSQRGAVEAYNRGQFDALAKRLARLSGRPLTDAAIAGAAKQSEMVRALQRRLMDGRRRGVISGVEALQAIGAAGGMTSAAYGAALSVFLADADQRAPDQGGRPRVLVESAVALDNPNLHAVLERAGALVVAEDDPLGSRAVDDDAVAASLDSLFQGRWRGSSGLGVYPPAARYAWFERNALAKDVDAVVFYVPPSDHLFGWDYPALKAMLDAAGKPSLLIRKDAGADGAAITTQAADFLKPLARSPR